VTDGDAQHDAALVTCIPGVQNMPTQAFEQKSSVAAWRATQVYTMAIICLIVGVAIGYLFRGSQSHVPVVSGQATTGDNRAASGMHQMPSLEQMKLMAETKAQPLLEELKSDPNNSDLLLQVGNIYKATHQFKEAQAYYERASKASPNNVAIRTELASSMYYNGDVDGAINELQKALAQNPKDADSLFNLGIIKWQGKQDWNGALAAWQELLKSNPHLSAERKATVQKLIAEVKQQSKSQLQSVSR
jgi:cytochrome c-type biogenesis protein CcmH/NrfG